MKIEYKKSALLIIDVQNDFCSGGALAVREGEAVVPPLNKLSRDFAAQGSPVVATQDWHPASHCSFAASGGMWPAHCVQGTHGAELHSGLDIKPISLILRKGFRNHLDSYSAFFENDKKTATGLAAYLSSLEIKNVYIGGLATDYCVLFSALDAAALGFSVFVIEDAARAVNYPEGSSVRAFAAMKTAGIKLCRCAE